MATMTSDPLAARLNQLAQANEDGLLSDDEYRLLRQSAFEQFVVESSSSPCPTPGKPKEVQPSSSTPSKRSLFPRLFRSKHSDLPPLRIDPHVPSNDSSKDIQQSISYTQSELERLTDAFDTLEQTLLRRLAKERARRLPATTPLSVDTLIEGREWREHRKIPSVASSPLLKDFDHSPSLISRPSFSAVSPMRLDPLPPRPPPLSSAPSTSTLSRKTSLSSHFTIKTFSRKPLFSPSHAETPEPVATTTTSPLRTQFWPAESSAQRPLTRKASVSSVSSHGTTVSTLASFSLSPFKTRSKNRMTSSTTATSITHSSGSSQAHASGSTLHLPLSPTGWSSSSRPSLDASSPRRLKHSRSETLGNLSVASERSEGDGDWDDPEGGDSGALLQQLDEMRQRRKEMCERYEGRLEYLRAKLRSAELHEKVRKK